MNVKSINQCSVVQYNMLYYKRVNGNMNLFHGSNILVQTPQIIMSEKTLDFGIGFYTTSSLEQAKKWAVNKTKREKQGTATVSVFSIDDDFLANPYLNVLNFQKADEKWLDFIMANRTNLDFNHSYDIVKGAVANDRVYASLNAFENGFMDKSTLLKELKTWVYVDQILFHTEKSIKLLSFSKGLIV